MPANPKEYYARTGPVLIARIKASKALITAKLGFFPGNCTLCPLVMECQTIVESREGEVLCELQDEVVGIDLNVLPQDRWLNDLHMPLWKPDDPFESDGWGRIGRNGELLN